MSTIFQILWLFYLVLVTAGAVFMDCVHDPAWYGSVLYEALLEIICALPALLASATAASIGIIVRVFCKSSSVNPHRSRKPHHERILRILQVPQLLIRGLRRP